MNTRLFQRVLPLAGLTALLACCGSARAGVLDLTLPNPNQTGVPGETFLFQGTITNNTPDPEDQTTLFLNFANFDPLNLSITELLSGRTFTIQPGDTSPLMNLFQVTLDPSAPVPQVYAADVFAQDNTLIGDSVTVSIDAVPEPGPALLLPLGAGLLLALRHRALR